MNRWAVAALLLFLCLGVSHAQKVQFRSTGLVSFTPASDVYLAALGNVLEADPASPEVRLRVTGQNSNYSLEVSLAPWTQGEPGTAELQARYTFSVNGRAQTTDWLPLGRTPREVLSSREKKLDIDVTYRLRVTGAESAGPYTTTVTYRVGNSTVKHDVRVLVPSALALRLGGVRATGGTAAIYFAYEGAGEVAVYLDAVERGVPLPITGSDLRQVEIFCNHPRGCAVDLSVSVSVSAANAPPASALTASDLLVGGLPADGRRFEVPLPTGGFRPLVTSEDFSLKVDGLEGPGAYTFQLLYKARFR